MTTTIRLRRDASSAWVSNNPILALGEPGFETDTRRLKIGDGSTAWNDLPFLYHGINVKLYGAVGNGTTDDTTFIQNAINAAVATGEPVIFPAGTYRVTAQLAATNLKGIYGTGKSSSAIVWDDVASCGIALTYDTTYLRKTVTIRDLSLRQKGRRGTALLLDYGSLPLDWPGLDSRFLVENVAAEGYSGSQGEYGWDIGFDAIAGAYGTFRDCDFHGFWSPTGIAGDRAPSAIGFRFRGTSDVLDNGHPVICTTDNCNVNFAVTGVSWVGCERAYARSCTASEVDTGFSFTAGSYIRANCVIEKSHANFHNFGIILDGSIDSTIIYNLLYRTSTSEFVTPIGIDVTNSNEIVGGVGYFTVTNNTIVDKVGTPALVGVHVGPDVTKGLIAHNVFRTVGTATDVDASATSITVGTNIT